MPYVSSPCRLNDHQRCNGTAAAWDELHECACPCHVDYHTRQRRSTPRPHDKTTRPTEPPGYLPTGLDGAMHARRLAIAIVCAALLYLALCLVTAGIAKAAAAILAP